MNILKEQDGSRYHANRKFPAHSNLGGAISTTKSPVNMISPEGEGFGGHFAFPSAQGDADFILVSKRGVEFDLSIKITIRLLLIKKRLWRGI